MGERVFEISGVVGSMVERQHLHRPQLLAVLVALTLLAACAGTPDKPPPEVPKPDPPKIVEEKPEVVDPPAEKPDPKPEGPPPSLEWMDWVASHCMIGKLPRSKYARGWLKWTKGDRSFLPEDAPHPVTEPVRLPKPGSEAARALAEKLRSEWLAEPKSRVVDCAFDVPRRRCQGCRPKHGSKKTHNYTALLPAALFERPERVRSVLMLLPGGNGGRARWFLTPVPGKGLKDAMSGGLETKRHVDAWVAANPDAAPSIVVALDHNGWGTPNGAIEYLTHDVPTHLAERYLGLSRDEVIVGAEGISSGSMSIWQAMRSKPRAFNTAGFMCMYCADDGMGIHPWGPETTQRAEVRTWLEALKAASDEGKLHIRFSIGTWDKGWECNKTFHTAFTQAGILEADPPSYSNCREAGLDNTDDCNTTWDGFHLYRDVGHTYALLIPAWVPQLNWHLDRLSDTVLR